jgi:hypothetical protein
MRFMMLVIPKGYETAAPDRMPDAKQVEQMMKYNESLANAGVLLSLDGLKPPSAGVRVSFTGGKPSHRWPVAEVKECVGGYWMIQVNRGRSHRGAVTPMSDNETIEVRRVHEMSDFLPTSTAAAVEEPKRW